MASRIFIDSFSGAASDLPKGRREPLDILRTLAEHPRVSTFDMSEHRWLWMGIQSLECDGLVEEDKKEGYPWHRYKVTPKGAAAIHIKEQ